MESEEQRHERIQAQKARIEESCNKIGSCLDVIKSATVKMEKALEDKKLT